MTPARRQNKGNFVAASVEKKLPSLQPSALFLINSGNCGQPCDIKNCIFQDSSNLSHWMDACICTSPTLIFCDSKIGPCSFVLDFCNGSFVSVCSFNCQSGGTKVCNILFFVFETQRRPAIKTIIEMHRIVLGKRLRFTFLPSFCPLWLYFHLLAKWVKITFTSSVISRLAG